MKQLSDFGISVRLWFSTVVILTIIVLIRLEDTALLLDSIRLFIILSAVMYTSRKINWYPSMQTAS